MKFSVIITTRDRPGPFVAAVESVLSQTRDDFELVVVDDGSAEEHLEAYRAARASLVDRIGERAVFVDLPRRQKGNGQGYAINSGVAASSGDYICFLDDDDCWTDDDYLRTVGQNFSAAATPVDLHYARQIAYRDGVRVERRLWIEAVEDVLRQRHGTLDPRQSYPLEVADLIATGNHAQVNTMIISRDLFAAMGGFDEQNRYEPDRDFFLRAIDRAREIRYLPSAIARHNVPDPSKGASSSTLATRLVKLIDQNRTCDRAVLLCERPAVRAHATVLKRYVVKHIADELYRQGRFREAGFYARQALLIGFNVKWLAFTLWMGLRSLAGRAAKGPKPAAGTGDAPGENLQPACNGDEPSRTQPPREA